jgi:hypothetical protein
LFSHYYNYSSLFITVYTQLHTSAWKCSQVKLIWPWAHQSDPTSSTSLHLGWTIDPIVIGVLRLLRVYFRPATDGFIWVHGGLEAIIICTNDHKCCGCCYGVTRLASQSHGWSSMRSSPATIL